MKKTRTTAKVKDITPNDGQLEWLPRNPRQWTKADIDKTAASLERDPDFLEDRPILLTPEMIAFAGNLRLTAAKQIKRKEVPVIIYTPETDEDYETIKRRTILDNGSFGAWDMDSLANEWDNGNLPGWGVPEWIVGTPGEEVDLSDLEIETNAGAGESKTGLTAITFLFPIDDAELVNAWIELNGKEKLVEKIVEICQEQEAK